MPDYRFEIEIYEGNGGQPPKEGEDRPSLDFANEGICAWMYYAGYQAGQTFKYPEEAGKLCPSVLDSLQSIITTLGIGGTLPWMFTGTPYEKEVDPEGVTTEFVRCTDPTASGIVVKVIKTAV